MKILIVLLVVCFVLLLGSLFSFASAQRSDPVYINGSVLKKVIVKGSNYEIPYSDLRVILINTTQRGARYDAKVCNSDFQKTSRDYVRTYSTDSKGSYNFSCPFKANSAYFLVICTGTNAVQITVPVSTNRYITVPTQRF